VVWRTIYPDERIWVGGQWFYLVGIRHPAVPAPEIYSAVLIGYHAVERHLDFDGHPSDVYLRAHTDQVNAVHDLSQRPPTPNTLARSPSANHPTRSSPRPRPWAG
jgi:putative ABC transport system permease protein